MSGLSRNSFRIAAALLAAFTFTLEADIAVAAETAREYRIPSQPLDKALREFALSSGMDLLFSPELVAGRQTAKLEGNYTVDSALKALLRGTGLEFSVSGTRIVISRPAAQRTNKLSAGDPGGAEAANAIMVQLAQADAAEAGGTDSASAPRKKSGDGVEEMIVEEGRIKPFVDANVDIPRTMNDPQPYYIFDSAAIERSGAANLEDFLKQRLTMNSSFMTNSQWSRAIPRGTNPTERGATSEMNLRGLGSDKTLVLINGRRTAISTFDGNSTSMFGTNQPDINGIPLGAVERIEVLPTSASGIYGSSALGGVINVILKKDYHGGEVRMTYDNTTDTDSSKRTAEFNYGMNLGKAQLTVGASWSDFKPLLLQDRRELFDRGFQTVLRNSPSSIYSSTSPFLGSLPNITSATAFVNGVLIPDPGTLTLRDGTPLNSRFTHISAGISPTTSNAVLAQNLLQNAGRWNLELPSTTQAPNGLLNELGLAQTTKSFTASLRYPVNSSLNLTLDWMRTDNLSNNLSDPINISGSLSVTAANPHNPFNSQVVIVFPLAPAAWSYNVPNNTSRDIISLGATAVLPMGWTGQADYSWSRSSSYSAFMSTNQLYADDRANFVIDPFVDTLAFPLSYAKYGRLVENQHANMLQDMALRASGPLPRLPWGAPTLTLGFEHRNGRTPTNYKRGQIGSRVVDGRSQTVFDDRLYYSREQKTDSVYAETLIPLVKAGAMPLLHSLEMQMAWRSERFEVDTGTAYVTLDSVTGAVLGYPEPTLNGTAYFSRSTYVSKNKTFGLKYQPLPQVILRGSLATAFLPPSPNQLLVVPTQPASGQVRDPRNNGALVNIQTVSGGNPNLLPQNSESLNAGIVWEPIGDTLKGLRMNAEYYKIEQFDTIGSLGAQQLLDNESTYAERITRDATGRIALIDTSLLNLYRRQTSGWDLSVDYKLDTPAGTFNLRAMESIILNLETQYSLTLPSYNTVGYPADGGAGKYKSNLTVDWQRGKWNAGWAARYFGSYKQAGALGGTNTGTNVSNTVIMQGSSTISSQTYHDLFVGYAFGDKPRGQGFAADVLAGTTFQLGIRNVFDKAPPLDVYYGLYSSPLGDWRLRSYWLSVRKSF